MGRELTHKVGEFRLLYLQPEPEVGERVCVGLVFDDPDRAPSLLFDPAFARVKCLAPTIDVNLLRFYLMDMQDNLRDSAHSTLALKSYGPHFVTSAPRQLAVTAPDDVRQRLFERFVTRSTGVDIALQGEANGVADKPAGETERLIAEFISERTRGASGRIVENATASKIIGFEPSVTIKPVAAALVGRSSVVLIDGVDLRHSRPPASINRVNRVVHTFWQYGRIEHDDHRLVDLPRKIHRVGLILDGFGSRSRANQEAHDYAMDQFERSSDLKVDNTSDADVQALDTLLADTIG